MKHIAIDLGAESSRIMVGDLKGLELMHRFPSKNISNLGRLYWDIEGIFNEIKRGLKKAFKKYGKEIVSLGIDAWGVDYALLDEKGQLLNYPRHYRDNRTDGIMEEYLKSYGREELYFRTGIQFLPFNTIFQLLAEQKENLEGLNKAESFLTIPDLLNYWLTGKMFNEFSIATTTQLLNSNTMDWDWHVLNQLEIPGHIFKKIIFPGEIVGVVSEQLAKELGIKHEVTVVAVTCHDTGSAVAAVPEACNNNLAFLSSGTWSLLGIELEKPNITKASLEANFTNEGGVGKRSRFLKNITGLWILQECKRFWDSQEHSMDYSRIVHDADGVDNSDWKIDVDDPRFLKPNNHKDNMIDRIKRYCEEKGYKRIPETPGEIAKTIFYSLATRYAENVLLLEHLTGHNLKKLNIIGGGAQNKLLCQLTAQVTGLSVSAGPVEATALGNVLVQVLALGMIPSIEEGRKMIAMNHHIWEYTP